MDGTQILPASADESALHWPLSPKIGEGSGSMKTSIQQHLLGILKPVNEHIFDLQQQTQQLRDDLAGVVVREAEQKTWLGHLDRQKTSHSDEIGTLGDGVVGLRASLDKAGQRQESVEAEQENMQTALGEILTRLSKAETSMETMQGSFADSQVHTAGRLSGLDDAVRKIPQLQTAIDGVKESHISLQNRHLDLSRCHQQTLLNCEDAQKRMASLLGRFEDQKVELGRAIVALNDRTFDSEKIAMDLADRMEGMAEASQRMEDKWHKVIISLGLLEQDLEGLKDAEDKVKENLAEEIEYSHREAQTHIQRLQNLESGLSKVVQGLASETEKSSQSRTFLKELEEEVSRSKIALDENAANIHSLSATQQQMGPMINSVASRAKQLEEGEAKLVTHADMVDSNLTVLNTFQQDAGKKIDTHMVEIERGKTKQERMRGDLGEADYAIKGLGSEFAVTSGRLVNVSERVDLAHEYFEGLEEGLKDLHRQAVGSTGTCDMLSLPSRSGLLPSLPGRSPQALAHKTV